MRTSSFFQRIAQLFFIYDLIISFCIETERTSYFLSRTSSYNLILVFLYTFKDYSINWYMQELHISLIERKNLRLFKWQFYSITSCFLKKKTISLFMEVQSFQATAFYARTSYFQGTNCAIRFYSYLLSNLRHSNYTHPDRTFYGQKIETVLLVTFVL